METHPIKTVDVRVVSEGVGAALTRRLVVEVVFATADALEVFERIVGGALAQLMIVPASAVYAADGNRHMLVTSGSVRVLCETEIVKSPYHLVEDLEGRWWVADVDGIEVIGPFSSCGEAVDAYADAESRADE